MVRTVSKRRNDSGSPSTVDTVIGPQRQRGHADHLRKDIAAKKALAVIPNNPSRALKYPLDKHLYAQRHLVECCFSKLKQFRRVATRFEKTARNYQAVVTLAAIVLWMR